MPNDQFMTLFEARRSAVEELLAMDPKDKKRFIGLAINEVSKYPTCSMESRIQCIIDAASCQLELGTPDHYAFLIPYSNKLTFQVGYTGMIKRAVDAKAAIMIFAELVYQNDTRGEGLVVHAGTEHKLEHHPKYFGDRGPLVGAYATALISTVPEIWEWEILEMKDINAIKGAAMRIQARGGQGKLSPAWGQFEGEMIKKSAIRRLCKRLQGDRTHATPQALEQYNQTRERDNDNYDVAGNGKSNGHGPAPNATTLGGAAEQIPGFEDKEAEPEPEEVRFLDLAEQDTLTSLIVNSGWPVRQIPEVLKKYAGVESSDQVKISDLPRIMDDIAKAAKERKR